jgi:thioredoxin reductase (NADPH)
VASGASAKWLGIDCEEQFVGNGYHSCATCDGFFYRGKKIIVVGGGDSAMEEANFLTKFASRVYLIHRSDNYKASKIMLQRCQNNPKIEFMPFRAITKFIGNQKGKVESVDIQNTITKEISNMPIGGVFVAIGHIPNSNFVGEILVKDELGYLLTQNHLPTRTSIYGNMSNFEGIFIAGDVEDKTYRQAITAAGDGCKAAMDLEKWLEN